MLCSAVLSSFSCVQLFATPWTVARQAPLSIGFSRQEYWNGLSCPPPGDLPDTGIKPTSLMSVSCIGRWVFLPLEPCGKPKLFREYERYEFIYPCDSIYNLYTYLDNIVYVHMHILIKHTYICTIYVF